MQERKQVQTTFSSIVSTIVREQRDSLTRLLRHSCHSPQHQHSKLPGAKDEVDIPRKLWSKRNKQHKKDESDAAQREYFFPHLFTRACGYQLCQSWRGYSHSSPARGPHWALQIAPCSACRAHAWQRGLNSHPLSSPRTAGHPVAAAPREQRLPPAAATARGVQHRSCLSSPAPSAAPCCSSAAFLRFAGHCISVSKCKCQLFCSLQLNTAALCSADLQKGK